MDHQYITVQQQVVVEALLLGLRKKCINDYFVSYDGHLKGMIIRYYYTSLYLTKEILILLYYNKKGEHKG